MSPPSPDSLISPEMWTNTTFDYLYLAGAMSLRLRFSPAAYLVDDQPAAERDHALYLKIAAQLDLDSVSPAGKAVVFALHNPLLKNPERLLSDSEAQPLRDYLASVLAYLDLRRKAKPAEAPGAGMLSIPLVMDTDLAAGDVLPVTLALVLTRKREAANHSSPSLETVSLPLLPQSDTDAEPGTYNDFVRHFETMFVAAGQWSLRVGTCDAQPGTRLWAVRLAASSVAPPEPLYYAARALSTSAQDLQLPLFSNYDASQPFPPSAVEPMLHTLPDIDAEHWLSMALGAVDNLLAPKMAAAIETLELNAKVSTPGTLEQLAKIRQSLVDSLAASASPLLEALAGQPQPDATSQLVASDVLRQALAAPLAAAFQNTAVVLVRSETDDEQTLRFYGQPCTLAKTDASQLEYCAWDISRIEHTVAGQSMLISLLTGPQRQALQDRQILEVAVPLWPLPVPPLLRGQQAIESSATPDTPQAMALWDYSFDVQYTGDPGDVYAIGIDFSNGQRPAPHAQPVLTPPNELLAALAQFVQIYPIIASALSDAQVFAADQTLQLKPAAAMPLQALVWTLNEVALSYRGWLATPQPAVAPTATQSVATLSFEAALNHENDPHQPATMVLSCLKINGEQATVDAGLQSLTAKQSGLSLPLPVMHLLPGQWRYRIVSHPGGDSVAFQYEAADEHQSGLLSYASAKNTTERTITINGLNIFDYRAGIATVQIIRNRQLLPRAGGQAVTHQAFVLTTKPLQFPDPALACLTIAVFALENLDDLAPSASYRDRLSAFFHRLAREPFLAGCVASYSYELTSAPLGSRACVPITVVPVVEFTSEVVGELVEAIEQWLSVDRPQGFHASLDIELTVCPDYASTPQLKINALTFTLDGQ